MAEQTKEIVQVADQAEAPIHGDILESMFSHVPLIDLVPACHVSRSWNRAVFTSLRCCNKLKPWLLLHSQRTRHPYSTTTRAYDPRSRLWVRIQMEHPINCISIIRSSHSTLLYMLSPNKFSFSSDPLHLTWHHVDPPLVWRTDPIVAFVGNRVVVAGGGCYFEDDPLAVEMYDLETQSWETCDSMPGIFVDWAASTWLSVAVDSKKMYLVEKSTGVACTFDPSTKAWRGPYDLRPYKSVCSSHVGYSEGRLILIGLIGVNNYGNDEVNSLKIWELNCESFELIREMGDMPEQVLESLKGERCSLSSISFNFVGNFVYISNSSSPGEIVLCELGESGTASSWSTVKNVVASDDSLLSERFVFTCDNVGLGHLHRAMMSKDCKVTVKPMYF